MHGRSANLRKGRTSVVGYYYHIVFSTSRRDPVFSDFSFARIVACELRKSDEIGVSETFSFVVMPDHVHWLLCLKSGSLSQCIQRVKANVSRQIGQKVWNKGFYDHGIRTDENLKNVGRYIVANPLRSGLVQNVRNYSHWDAAWI